MAFNPNASNLNQEQIIQQVFDPDENRLRVDAVVTATIADVVIHSDESSITIGNPNNGNTLDVQSDGSINVNTTLLSTVDNIAIGNQAGTNFVSVNTDGSINTVLEGLPNFQTSQYTIGTSAIQITIIPLVNRSSVGVKAICTFLNMIYVGNSNTVTPSTGWPLFNGDTLELDLTGAHQIWAIATAAGQTLAAIEIGS